MKKILFTIIGIAALSLVGGHAQTIISFQETGAAGDLSSSYPIDFINDSLTGITLTADSNLDVATLSLGTGATAGTAAGSLGFANAGSASDLSAAITGNFYHSINLDPSSGYQLNISGITYNADASSSTSTFVFNILSSATGFTSSDSLGSFSVINSAAASGTIDTSGVSALQGVDTLVELRIYVHRSAGTGTAAYYADDGVNGGLFSVNGTVAIPEPGTFLLFGIGAAAIIIRRKLAKV